MNCFEIRAKDLPFRERYIHEDISSIEGGPDNRLFVHCHRQAILELDPETFRAKGEYLLSPYCRHLSSRFKDIEFQDRQD